MRRRRGSVLIASLIVMLVLMIFGGAIFAFAYTNFRSAEQQRGIMMARAAADSLLYSLGAVISDDFAAGSPTMPISVGNPLSARFQDGPLSADIHVSTSDGKIFVLECTAQYGTWQSGTKILEIVRRTLGAEATTEWIWR